MVVTVKDLMYENKTEYSRRGSGRRGGSSTNLHSKQAKTIDEYISVFPENIQNILEKLRQAIKESAPEAEETISYQIPTFKLNGNLVHFGAFKDHVAFFPTSSGKEAFKKELSQYKGGKGTIQFPIDKPIPYGLVGKIVKFRVRENLNKKKNRK